LQLAISRWRGHLSVCLTQGTGI